MEYYKISKSEARQFLLKYQGLLPPRKLEGKDDILAFIKQVGCIQFDPLNIAGHNQELVLQSRVSNFTPSMLNELLYEQRELLDGWDKNMSIYPTKDWPYFKRLRENNLKNLIDTSSPVIQILPEIRRAIASRGPLSSLELNNKKTIDWAWAPTSISRAALESMYFWGELIIHHRVNTRRVYDFANKHLPLELLSEVDPNLSEEAYYTWYVLRRLGSVGLLWDKSSDAWLGMPKLKSEMRSSIFKKLLEEKKLSKVMVEDMEIPLYIKSSSVPLLESVLASNQVIAKASIIAPLDNLLWDRKLIRILFDFDYVWEVYKPVSERLYGYYVLPVLYGDKFIARFDPLRDKKNNSLTIKNWWWESNIELTQGMKVELIQAFKEFLSYLQVDKLEIDKSTLKNCSLNWLLQANI
jgi:uncharacterized protein